MLSTAWLSSNSRYAGKQNSLPHPLLPANLRTGGNSQQLLITRRTGSDSVSLIHLENIYIHRGQSVYKAWVGFMEKQLYRPWGCSRASTDLHNSGLLLDWKPQAFAEVGPHSLFRGSINGQHLKSQQWFGDLVVGEFELHPGLGCREWRRDSRALASSTWVGGGTRPPMECDLEVARKAGPWPRSKAVSSKTYLRVWNLDQEISALLFGRGL